MCDLPRQRQELRRRHQSQDQAGDAYSDYRGVRNVSRGGQLHELRQHGDESRAGGGDAVRDLSRDGEELVRGDDRDAADGGAGSVSPGDGRVRDLSHVDDVVWDGDEQAGQSRSDHGGVHAVPRQPAGVVQAGGDEPQRDQQRLHDVSCGGGGGDAVLRGDAAAAGGGAYPDQRRLRDLSQLDGQVRSGYGDEPRRDQHGMCDLSRQRQELRRRHQPQDQAGDAYSDYRGVRNVSRGGQLHELRQHGDESRAGGGDAVRDLSRDGEELVRGDDRDAADGGAGSVSPGDGRVRDLSHVDDVVWDGDAASRPITFRPRRRARCATPTCRRRTSRG